jgi:type IV secretion system protein VirD4
MLLGAIIGFLFIPFVIVLFTGLSGAVYSLIYERDTNVLGYIFGSVGIYLARLLLAAIFFVFFNKWFYRQSEYAREASRFGSARFAKNEDLLPFRSLASMHADKLSEKMTSLMLQPEDLRKQGLYIGGGDELPLIYDKAGHLLTCAGTRGGKGTNLIIPNLLGLGGFDGSIVCIDPKGENAAVSADYWREQGKKVVVLNPWNLMENYLLPAATDAAADAEPPKRFRYAGQDWKLKTERKAREKLPLEGYFNPLDALRPDEPQNWVDNAALIAEMIVPIGKGGKDDHWNSRARSIITALIVYNTIKGENKTLLQVWEQLRLNPDAFGKLIIDMDGVTAPSDHEAAKMSARLVRLTAGEILSLMENGAREFASIMSTAQRYTDFLKSPALAASMSGTDENLNLSEISQGETVVYIVIPADKIKNYYQWLRLCVSVLMRSVVQNPNPAKRTLFLLDEFYALGYLSEIETAMGLYAGFGVSVWAILQNLVQLEDLYGKGWENFIANCSVIHGFNMNENTTLEYFSRLGGETSRLVFKEKEVGATPRRLITPDELRRASQDKIFCFIDRAPLTYFDKMPYYHMASIKLRAQKNPYYNS